MQPQGEFERAELSSVVRLVCDLAALEEKLDAGISLDGSDELNLATLRRAMSDPGERRHQRLPVEIPAIVRARSRRFRAGVLDISGGGMRITTGADLDPDELLQVTIGSGGSFQVSFSCRVQRVTEQLGEKPVIGLRFEGVPVQLRRDREPSPGPDLVATWLADPDLIGRPS